MVSIEFSSIYRDCRTIENVFRITVVRFRAFETCLTQQVVSSDVVIACYALHNFL
jgi:hypothetical protein